MTDLATDIQNNPTIFGKIMRAEVPRDVIYEDDKIIAFRNIVAPVVKVHAVIIPKQRIGASAAEIQVEHAELLGYLWSKIPHIAELLGIKESGFRIITNAGPDSGQEVPHIHFHILGGEKLGALVGC